jgi:ABC-2 type transport system permease protein
VVAHLLRLRLLLLKNTLLRSRWQLVAVVIGGLYGLGLLAGVVAGLVALSLASVDLAQTVVVLAGSALILGWTLIPLLTSGIDQSLDTAKLARFPLPRNTLILGLTLAGVVGIPGVVTSLASLATALTWWRLPLVAVVALLCGAVGALTAVVGSRMTVALSSSLGANRRFRELSALLLFIPLVLIGPGITLLTGTVADSADLWPRAAAVLSWSPLGAVWAVPGEIAAGHPGAAALKALIALATIALLVTVWRRALGGVLDSPPRASSRSRAAGRIGLLGVLPATPTGAVAARSLTYWMRDPRYAAQLIFVPLMPVILVFNGALLDNPGLVLAAGPIVASLLAFAIYTDISYDNTAFAAHLAAGLPGRADRAGRVIALAVFALPILVLLTVGSVWYADAWTALPGMLGLVLGLILSGMGLSSVTSARIVMPVPLPGDSPLKAKPGAQVSAILSSLVTWAILAALVLPELVLMLVGAFTGDIVWGWAALVVGTSLGATLTVLGIRIGGRTLDRTGPDLLARLVRQR